MLNIKLIFLVFSFLTIFCDLVAVADGMAKNKGALFKEDRTIGGISIGETSILSIKERHGGIIQKKTDADGSFNSLCLIVNRGSHRYLLSLISGAMGGWDIVTEYESSVVNSGYSNRICGEYTNEYFSPNWIGYKVEDIIRKYGEPSKLSVNTLEYSFSYQKGQSETGVTDIYSGIMVYFDEKKVIYKVNVFEVESD